MSPTKEEVYDRHISPLMAEIIEICRERKIAMLCDFALGDDLKCTSALLDDDFEPTPEMLKSWSLLRPRHAI